MAVHIEWEGKPQQVERLALPFQIVETINESRATRERETGSLFGGAAHDRRGGTNSSGATTSSCRAACSRSSPEGQPRLHRSALRHRHGLLVPRPGGRRAGDEAAEHPRGDAYRDTWGAGRSLLPADDVRAHHVDLRTADGRRHSTSTGANVSHYLKVLCDEIFGAEASRNEIIWKRQTATATQGRAPRHLGRLHDTILLYREGRRDPVEHAIHAV